MHDANFRQPGDLNSPSSGHDGIVSKIGYRAARVSIPGALEWLIRNSVSNSELLRDLEDSRDWPDVKVDARIRGATFDSLRGAAAQLQISQSVYIRRLLFHFYITKRVKYVKSEGRYTLAYRHE
jgi:hypothetical protein